MQSYGQWEVTRYLFINTKVTDIHGVTMYFGTEKIYL